MSRPAGYGAVGVVSVAEHAARDGHGAGLGIGELGTAAARTRVPRGHRLGQHRLLHHGRRPHAVAD